MEHQEHDPSWAGPELPSGSAGDRPYGPGRDGHGGGGVPGRRSAGRGRGDRAVTQRRWPRALTAMVMGIAIGMALSAWRMV